MKLAKQITTSLSVAALSILVIPFIASCTADIPELNPTEIINTLFPNA